MANKPTISNLSRIISIIEKYSPKFTPYVTRADRTRNMVISEFEKSSMGNNHVELLEHWGAVWDEDKSYWYIQY